MQAELKAAEGKAKAAEEEVVRVKEEGEELRQVAERRRRERDEAQESERASKRQGSCSGVFRPESRHSRNLNPEARVVTGESPRT